MKTTMKTTQKSNYSFLKLLTLLIFSLLIFKSEKNMAQDSEGWLYTEGNKIKNSDGTNFMGRGVNMFTTRPCGAYEGRTTADVLAEIDELVNNWGANLLRLCLVNNNVGVAYDPTVTTGSILTDQTYRDQLVAIAEHVEAMPGVYAIFDIWWDQNIDKHNGGVPADADLPEFIETWEKLTEILKPYSHVLFGICNEPLANGDFSRDKIWNVMNEVAKAIRAKEDTNKHIILAPGIDRYGRDIDYYVNHELVYENDTKIENIVYESHVYNNRNEWQDMLFTPGETIPALTGEFGPDQYMTLEETIEFMELSEEKGIPWTAWIYGNSCGGEKDMINSNGSITNWGEIIKTHILNASNDGPKVSDFTSSIEKVWDHEDTEISFSATVTGKDGKTISSVILDLSEIGGGSAVTMDPSGDQYSKNYTIGAGTATTGVKTIKLTATDNEDVIMTSTLKITVSKLATSALVIYNDASTLITKVEKYNGTDVSEVNDGGAAEGSKHYEFKYDYPENWAGVNVVLKDRIGLDFSGYESIQLSCKVTGELNQDIMLCDADDNAYKVNITKEANHEYKTFIIPLSKFSDVNLSLITCIRLYVGGPSKQSGSFYFDDIKLISADTGAVTGVTLTPESATMNVDETLQLTATVAPENATNQDVSWKSSNPSVATVSATGLITAISAGNAIITVTTDENDFSDTSNVAVEDDATGIAEESIQKKGFKMYPNPASGDVVTLKLHGIEGDVKLKVTNMIGKVVQEEEIYQKDEFMLKTSGLSKGMYIISLNLADNLSYKQLIVIK
jgi:hypothetical protein